jgi:hypothetical protein
LAPNIEEGQRPRVSEDRVLRRIFGLKRVVTGVSRKLRNEDLQIFPYD